MRRRRTMYPETALYIANYILSSVRPSVYEPLYYSRYGKAPVLETFCTPHQGLGGYWMSPQRHHHSGTLWRDPRRHQVVFPGNTGFSDVVSTLPAGYCRIRHSLVWRHRWRKLKEQIRELHHR